MYDILLFLWIMAFLNFTYIANWEYRNNKFQLEKDKSYSNSSEKSRAFVHTLSKAKTTKTETCIVQQ